MSDQPDVARQARRRQIRILAIAIVAVVALDILAYILVPPHPPGEPGAACPPPVCFINGNLEFPPPEVIIDLDPGGAQLTGALAIGFHASITSTLATMWVVEILILVVMIAATRRMRLVPRGLQNLVEWGYELLENFALSVGGVEARKFVPLYAAFFILIMFSNWSGLAPEIIRAPTSDVNVTIGLALVAFGYFEFQGFRANGIPGYLGKFFPVYEFRKGVGAGAIAMFVGLIELLLEFVKPVTLAMRLFGNIYGGEVGIGVMTGLTVALFPVALIGLELILNFAQALIFSVLTLMFTLIAVETHHDEGDLGEEAMSAVHDGELVVAVPAH